MIFLAVVSNAINIEQRFSFHDDMNFQLINTTFIRVPTFFFVRSVAQLLATFVTTKGQ
jgi:hypothetical protein